MSALTFSRQRETIYRRALQNIRAVVIEDSALVTIVCMVNTAIDSAQAVLDAEFAIKAEVSE